MTLGAKIRKARLRAGKSHRDVANALGVMIFRASAWETDTSALKPDQLTKLAEFLKAPELLEATKKKVPAEAPQ